MPQKPDYYRILGVAPSADEAVLRRAYRALAKRYHPDYVLSILANGSALVTFSISLLMANR